MPERAVKYMSLQEFLQWEDGTDTRWELIDGVPVAMAPPRFAHGVLAVRLGGRIEEALRTRTGCMVQSEAGIVRPDRQDTFFVADLAVTCTRHDPDQQITQEPVLVCEVLSPTPIAFDRQVKIPDYRRVASVREILAIDSVSVFAEVMRREGERWITEIVQGRAATLLLTSIGLTVEMGDLYEAIDVPEKPRPRSARRRRL